MSQPEDPCEQEAERVALSLGAAEPSSTKSAVSANAKRVVRRSAAEGDDKQIIHLPGPSNWLDFNRFARNDMVSTWQWAWRTFFGITQVSRLGHRRPPQAPSRVRRRSVPSATVAGIGDVGRVVSRPGNPLPAHVQQLMGERLGHDFGSVRVHTDSEAAASAAAFGAQAYTVGRHLVFGQNQYKPETPAGMRLLAHELVHVVQAAGGVRRQRTPAPSRPNYWKRLPADAQLVLDHSFRTRQPREWIWHTGPSAEACYNSLALDDRRTAFLNVYTALARQGLWIWVQRVLDFWPRNTQGIQFTPVSRGGLVLVLNASPTFCSDKWIGGGRASEPKWRQVVPTGTPGLHLSLPLSRPCLAHIDLMTPVEGREPDGKCNYDVLVGIKHWWKEEKGW